MLIVVVLICLIFQFILLTWFSCRPGRYVGLARLLAWYVCRLGSFAWAICCYDRLVGLVVWLNDLVDGLGRLLSWSVCWPGQLACFARLLASHVCWLGPFTWVIC